MNSVGVPAGLWPGGRRTRGTPDSIQAERFTAGARTPRTNALEYLRASNAITTSPRQTAIRPHTPKNVRITSTGTEQGDLFSYHGTTADGRLFRGVRGGPLSESLYGRVWAAARAAALSPEEVASPLARRPYDLRHAAVSTWLNGGVPAPQVAAWAGHSVNVLLRVYATCIAGQDDAVRRRVEAALRAGDVKIRP